MYTSIKSSVFVHYRWHYAYTSILEETVRRRRKMWSWDHIKQHRSMKYKYREAYIKKLENKKVSGDLQKELDVCCIKNLVEK